MAVLGGTPWQWIACSCWLLLLAVLLVPGAAHAVVIELHDVASDRVERQRAYAHGNVPLPGTPDLAQLDGRLASAGLAKGNPILIRVFKLESELEVWLRRADRYQHFATYPVCHWTGSIGPKLREGDKQSPEGFYAVAMPQTRLVGRWRNAIDLGYPNHLDQIRRRTGSHILIHGGCSSVGCFAMTDQVQQEIYELADAALRQGQERFQVHVFPFRMTDAKLAEYADHPAASSWVDLKPGYDSFERTRLPPRIGICEGRYQIADGAADDPPDPRFWPRLPSSRRGEGESAEVCSTERWARSGGRIPSDGQIATGTIKPAAPKAIAVSATAAPESDGPSAAASPPAVMSPAAVVPSQRVVPPAGGATPVREAAPLVVPPGPAQVTAVPAVAIPTAVQIDTPRARPGREARHPVSRRRAREVAPAAALDEALATTRRARRRDRAAADVTVPAPEPARRQRREAVVIERYQPSLPSPRSARPARSASTPPRVPAVRSSDAEPRFNGLGESIARNAPRIVNGGN